MKKYLGLSFGVGFAVLTLGLFWNGYAVNNDINERSQTKKAPNFELVNLDGQKVKLSDFDGKIRIVDFWATWCPPCRAEIPHFNSLVTKYPDIAILGIALDQEGPSVVRPFAKEYQIQYPLLMGNIETVQAFGNIQSIPTTFVIDQEGFIIKKYVGYRPESVFEADIRALLKSGS